MIRNVIYILPAGGYSGGANSVVQEVSGFQEMGINASIAVDAKNYATFLNAYASIPAIASSTRRYNTKNELSKVLSSADLVVATVATSVPDVVSAWNSLREGKRPKMFYYIQDYEPLFYLKESSDWLAAVSSYEHNTVFRGFAKTEWICETVERRHGMRVSKVKASIDHNTFFPQLSLPQKSRLTIAAMIRPDTPRRAPRRTVRVMNKIAAEYGDQINLVTFGCSRDKLRDHGLDLAPVAEHRDQLTREQVAHTLRQTDLFLDLSDYQAFGRTGLESMACGAVPVLPIYGGAIEYVRHRENGYLVDVCDDQGILHSVQDFVRASKNSRRTMRVQSMKTAAEYTTRSACASILDVFLSG